MSLCGVLHTLNDDRNVKQRTVGACSYATLLIEPCSARTLDYPRLTRHDRAVTSNKKARPRHNKNSHSGIGGPCFFLDTLKVITQLV